MKIDDIESKKLLPNWAHDADWIQAAFDQIVLMCTGRLHAIDAPLTMQAIQCLTDEELREWYARFGVVEYYPDLNRETREKMLYWLARLYRYLGTPHAIRVLCDYVYNDLPLDVTVIDNLAFDGETLVDPTLLDLFDIEIDAGSAGISPTQAYRLVNNILRIARNSQTLRKIIYEYSSDIDVNCGACSYGGDVCIDYSDNDEIARDVTPPGPELPTVTRQWLYATSSVTTIDLYAGESSGNIYEQVGTSFVAKQVNPSVLQCVFGWRGTSASDYGFGTFETVTTGTGGYVRAKNITSSRIAGIFYFRYAECSDPTATVVTVYNASLVAYNAFKFTAGGTDYYYVLDGVQADWTDDLSSIGYTELVTAYTKSDKTNKYISAYGHSDLLDKSGNSLFYDNTKTYMIIGVFLANGTQITGSNVEGMSINSNGDYLAVYNNSVGKSVGYVTYITRNS